MRHVIKQLPFWFGQQPVANANFFLGRRDVNRGWNGVGTGLAILVLRLLGRLAARQQGLAQILCFQTKNLTGDRVFQCCGLTKYPVHLLLLAEVILQGSIGRPAGIGAIAFGQQDAPFLRRHDAWRGTHHAFVNDHRFCQIGLDQVKFQSRNGATTQCFVAGTGRQAYRGQRLGGACGGASDGNGRIGDAAQGRLSVLLFQVKPLSGVNQVRILDVGQIHAPQLGPAPGRLQE